MCVCRGEGGGLHYQQRQVNVLSCACVCRSWYVGLWVNGVGATCRHYTHTRLHTYTHTHEPTYSSAREGKWKESKDNPICHDLILLCGDVCCSVLQCVAVCYSVLQCVAVSKPHVSCSIVSSARAQEECDGCKVAVSIAHQMCCGVLQCAAVCCSVLAAQSHV